MTKPFTPICVFIYRMRPPVGALKPRVRDTKHQLFQNGCHSKYIVWSFHITSFLICSCLKRVSVMTTTL